jgi:hypothetical protein
MKINVGLTHRVHLVSTLPVEGDFISLTIKKDILEKVNLTQKEITDWEVKFLEGGRITWNADKVKKVEIQLTDAETEMIKAVLIKLNNEKKLTEQSYELYDMFIANPKL